MQLISSTMESAQTEGVCIFRTLPFLYGTGIIKLIALKGQSTHLHIHFEGLLVNNEQWSWSSSIVHIYEKKRCPRCLQGRSKLYRTLRKRKT